MLLSYPPLACFCNSFGSTTADGFTCNDKCCNDDGTCTCTTGYSTIDCNTCDIGYYASATVNGENTCNGNYQMIPHFFVEETAMPFNILLACICNSIGSTKADDTACANKCCNDDGSCKCSDGYSGDDCNTCDSGYYVSATVNGENTCTGNAKWFQITKVMYIHFLLLACICNSLGSTKADDSACDNKCCNDDGSCTCTPGYSTIDCNTCDIGYYVSDTAFDENSCTGIFGKKFEGRKYVIFYI